MVGFATTTAETTAAGKDGSIWHEQSDRVVCSWSWVVGHFGEF